MVRLCHGERLRAEPFARAVPIALASFMSRRHPIPREEAVDFDALDEDESAVAATDPDVRQLAPLEQFIERRAWQTEEVAGFANAEGQSLNITGCGVRLQG